MLDYDKHRDVLLLAGRVLGSLLFLIAGYNKLMKHDFYIGYFGKLGVPMPSISVPGAMVFEIVGGILLLVGYKTRSVAWMLGLYSFVAGLFAHLAWGDPNQLNHFFKNVTIFGALLAFTVAGPGTYSIDKK
ncbi:DoxX family protein [Rhodoplanes sp. Z2-YC6860]|uniref:DoxX family protein n=1 Tax=Rhodoplanes sp. Z2-YC6860 TaxID=674703 RepID=UPI00078EE506|nr:DoxX family protein [Rhodoplanes sp. Z2-YC6860]AMN43120.1 DoxX family protein [Rhodoplanes sp. Z2-YC6860]